MLEDIAGYIEFQFTPLREGLLFEFVYLLNSSEFQFTPLREGLHVRLVPSGSIRNFNSRPCGRGFPSRFSGGPVLFIFQFTPLREGLRVLILAHRGELLISIHAPAGGASEVGAWIRFNPLISIHAPAGGASGDGKL